MFKNIKIDTKKYVCTVSYIRIFLQKSKIKDDKENIFLLFFTVFNMQLTKQQRVFLVTAWMRSKSYRVVSQICSENFPERNIPNKITILKNVKKYREEVLV